MRETLRSLLIWLMLQIEQHPDDDGVFAVDKETGRLWVPLDKNAYKK